MKENQIRVVIDTNLWISFLMGKTLSDLANHLISDEVKLLFSNELLDELVEVLQRPKFKSYFSAARIRELLAFIHAKAELVEVEQHFEACRDAKDNFLLDLCVSGKAHYLITGDKDLLVLNQFQGTEIMTHSAFEKLLQL